MRLHRRAAVLSLALSLIAAGPAVAQSYFLNGRPMSHNDAAMLRSYGLPAGNYAVDAQGYVWGPGGVGPLTRVAPPPPSRFHQGPIASGNAYPDGSSSVYIPGRTGEPGFQAGRHSDGCIYMSNGYSPDC